SIITVVYNNVRDIAYTIESVLCQTYTNIEYIIVDGASTDGTLDVITSYHDRIDVVISEKDKGIYDAMNKGLAAAHGDYVLFLNSGDELFDENTIQNVVEEGKGADIIYGNTKLVNEQRHIIGDRRHRAPVNFNWQSFRYGMNICHQAIYVKRSIAEPYDLQYQLSGDIDWVIRAAKKAKSTKNVNIYVVKYLVGGLSKKRHRQSLKERYYIFRKHYGTFPNFLNHFVIAVRLFKHRILHGKIEE